MAFHGRKFQTFHGGACSQTPYDCVVTFANWAPELLLHVPYGLLLLNWALSNHCYEIKAFWQTGSMIRTLSQVNDATRYAQLLQERRKTAMTHTQSFVGEGFGEKYSEW